MLLIIYPNISWRKIFMKNSEYLMHNLLAIISPLSRILSIHRSARKQVLHASDSPWAWFWGQDPVSEVGFGITFRGKTASNAKSPSTYYNSGYSTSKLSDGKFIERTESYNKELEEFPPNHHVPSVEEGNRNSYVSQLRSIKTKSSKFGKLRVLMWHRWPESRGSRGSAHEEWVPPV